MTAEASSPKDRQLKLRDCSSGHISVKSLLPILHVLQMSACLGTKTFLSFIHSLSLLQSNPPYTLDNQFNETNTDVYNDNTLMIFHKTAD